MVYSKAEISYLRLCAWCKDLPVSPGLLSDADVQTLIQTGQIRISKSGQSIRVTDAGYSLLNQAGYNIEPDRQCRGVGPQLTRRLNTAELILMLVSAGVDVFCSTCPEQNNSLSFLPSFALRRSKVQNILGGSRFSGLLYAGEYCFAVYYVRKENDGVYPETEQNTFSMPMLSGNRKHAVLFTGQKTLSELVQAMRYGKTSRSGSKSYMEAAAVFSCPMQILSLSQSGIQQLKICCVQNYRNRIMNAVLGNRYSPPHSSFWDAEDRISGEAYMLGLECNILRIERAVKNAEQTLNIVMLREQEEQSGFIRNMLAGTNAVIRYADGAEVERCLGIQNESKPPDNTPYITPEGGYLNAPTVKAIGRHRK